LSVREKKEPHNVKETATIGVVFVVVCLGSARMFGADVSLYAVTKAQAYI